MAKVIKFNLIVDGQSIRSLEDLRDNFNIDDVYELYRSGVLKKWLDVRGYAEEAEAVEDLANGPQDDLFILIPRLIKIFLTVDASNLNRYTQSSYATLLKLFNEDQLKKSANDQFEQKSVIERYHSSYTNLKEDLKNEYQNFNFIKSYLAEIERNHLDLFMLDYKSFYYEHIKESPLIVFLTLANPAFRSILLQNDRIKENLKLHYKEQKIFEQIGPHLQEFKGTTNGMWKYLGDKGKNYMVIYLTAGSCSVGSQSRPDLDVSAGEVNGQYMIFEGLLFKSAPSTTTLRVVYMEV